MSNYAISLKRTSWLLAALAFTAALMIANLSIFSARADASQLLSRSLSLASSLDGTQTAGTQYTETNGSDTEHTFTFTLAVGGTVQAVLFKYCTTAIGTCTAPTNMSNQNSTLNSETLSSGVYSNDTTNLQTEDAECTGANGRNNCLGITTSPAGAETTGPHTIVFRDIKNPESIGTFFVRISMWSAVSGDDYQTLLHEGTVASATTNGIAITTRVVETLGFSTEAGTSFDAPGANCAPLTGTGALNLGLAPDYTLAINTTYDAYSGIRLYTNSANGTVVQYEGATLTKGSDTIDGINSNSNPGSSPGTAAAPSTGVEQFGLAADLTADSSAIANANTTEGGTGQVNITNDYDGGNGTIASGTFAFVADTKTSIGSSSSYVTCDTYAIQHIANISALTAAGTYTTTIVWFAVPTY